GTEQGLLRYDGVRFTVFDSAHTPSFSNDNVLALFEDRRGVLWVGTQGGGLLRYEAGQVVAHATLDSLADDRILALAQDEEGDLWIGSEAHGLYRMRDGMFTRFSTRDGLASEKIKALQRAREGGLWIATELGLNHLQRGALSAVRAQGLPDGPLSAVYEDSRGDVWVGTSGQGLARIRNGTAEVFTSRDGLPNPFIRCIAEDTDKNLWLGTDGGGV